MEQEKVEPRRSTRIIENPKDANDSDQEQPAPMTDSEQTSDSDSDDEGEVKKEIGQRYKGKWKRLGHKLDDSDAMDDAASDQENYRRQRKYDGTDFSYLPEDRQNPLDLYGRSIIPGEFEDKGRRKAMEDAIENKTEYESIQALQFKYDTPENKDFEDLVYTRHVLKKAKKGSHPELPDDVAKAFAEGDIRAECFQGPGYKRWVPSTVGTYRSKLRKIMG